MLEPRLESPEELSQRLDALGNALRAQESTAPPPALESLVAAHARSVLVQRCLLLAAAVASLAIILIFSWRSIFGTLPQPNMIDSVPALPTIELLRRMNPDASVEALRLPPSRSGGNPAAPGPRDTLDPAGDLDDAPPNVR